ncbi:hypothetical protein AKJ54_01000 [candidate division MSBL1 archaeon SCGC-AAA382K21]|uniref:Ferrous iron transport protein B n=1 Tax=candidate division MSBL1 archaeon SCGC-AAA382K21 TaxID=1698283 RepID=A0A133VKC4_9EURY|nr:hypothetical protein AKJ54_01000 [candidate division MSBL1 archaeon SCGC-AAA382K21]
MEGKNADVVVGLAGNPNVGKSAFFHQVTGIGVTISNYPGTTVEISEGVTEYKGYTVKMVDLPGVYSIGAVAEDEWVARREILERDVDVIVDVVDASNLERNLYLALQLIELDVPLVIVLNQYDMALKEGIKVDPDVLSEELGVPVVTTVATQGKNVSEALEKAIEVGAERVKPSKEQKMGKELEKIIESLSEDIREKMESTPFNLPPRALAIKLLEGDEELISSVMAERFGKEIIQKTEDLAEKIKYLHGEAAAFRIARERHGLASMISEESTEHVEVEPPLSERISRWTTEAKTGIPILIGVFLGLLMLLFYGGGFIEKIVVGGWESYVQPHLLNLFQSVSPRAEVTEILDIGVNLGIKGILAVMFPYILVFFLALALLEDSGYLSRVAYLMDSTMHKMGLHGKAVVPMLGGFGCNVPAIVATRGLTSRRQRLISSFLITMVPCSARTAVILGTVSAYAGIYPALTIYGIILGLIFVIGLSLNKFLPGETSGMVMEMPPLRRPMLKPVLSKTWSRMREFVYVAAPLLILGSFSIGILDASGIMDKIVDPLSPVTVGLLGLPAVVIIPLLYGIIRKEGALVLLVAVAGTSNLANFMSPLQLFVFALVVAIYVPCVATIAVLKKELGWKEALAITVFTIVLALVIGGLIFYLNPLGLAS